MHPPQSDKNVIDEDKAQLMTRQLMVELGLDVDSYSISNRYVLLKVTIMLYVLKSCVFKSVNYYFRRHCYFSF